MSKRPKSPKRRGNLPITVDPEVMSGAPVFAGIRVPVESLFTNLEGGVSLDEYLDAFPDVKRAQAMAVLDYAHRSGAQIQNMAELAELNYE